MKLLIATDGSEDSKRAIENCCRMFSDSKNPEIKVVTVFKSFYPLPLPLVPFVVPETNHEKFDREAKEEAEKITKEAAEIIRKLFPDARLTTTTEQLSGGTVSQKIIEKTREWKSDLIVVGSHHRGFWGRLTNGSTSDELVHHAPCPVLVFH